MRARPLTIAGRLALVVAALLLCAGIAQAAGVRLAALPGTVTGGFAATDSRVTAAPQTTSVGGTPGPGIVVGPVIRRSRPIAAVPAIRTIRPGARTTFQIRIQPGRTVRSYRLKLWRAPAGIGLRLNHRRTKRLALVTVRTAPGLRLGRYRLRISAYPRRVPGVRRNLRVLRATMTLVVAYPSPVGVQGEPAPPGKLFAAGEVAEPLAPGVTRPVRLVLTNALDSAVDVIALTVTVLSVAPVDGGSCTTADFTTTPAALATPLRIPAQTSATLQTLGLAAGAWPSVTMVNRPVSQDGCKGASVALRFDVQGREPA